MHFKLQLVNTSIVLIVKSTYRYETKLQFIWFLLNSLDWQYRSSIRYFYCIKKIDWFLFFILVLQYVKILFFDAKEILAVRIFPVLHRMAFAFYVSD